jgi:hypothetical protein
MTLGGINPPRHTRRMNRNPFLEEMLFLSFAPPGRRPHRAGGRKLRKTIVEIL